MTGGVAERSEQLSWSEIKARTLQALDAMIEHRAATVSLKAVSNSPVALPDRSSRLLTVQTVRPPRGGWNGQTFFVVDADQAGGRRPPKHEIHLMYPPKAQRVVGELTPSLRRALGTATHVRMMYSDDVDLNLMRMLRSCLQEVTRGPLVPELWSTERLRPHRAIDGLNHEQSAAFAAFTTGGAWLVWGPPGTGKTTVIVKAVAEALTAGRSVLIASNTHVAVDNVVKDLAGIVQQPGQVVRIGDQQKIDPEVLDHEWLTIDRAAATLTDRAAKLAEISEKMRANEQYEDRKALVTLSDELADLDIDLATIENAQRARAAAADVPVLRARAEALRGEARTLAAEAALLRTRADDVQPDARLLADAIHAEEELRGRQHSLALRRRDVDNALRAALDHCHDLRAVVAEISATRASWAGRLPWRAAELDRHWQSTASELQQAQEYAAGSGAELDAIDTELANLEQAAPGLTAAATEAKAADGQARCLREQAAECDRRGEERAADARTSTAAAEAAQRQADSVPDHDAIIATAEAHGIAAKITECDRLNEVVSALDRELEEIENGKRKLDDEYANTKRQLLETAPVIACTLTALTTKPELANRRYDTVIVDEAASASIPHLIHAGSKADRCLAFVGDFLQNSPIAEVDDAVTQEQRALLPWQRDDIFALHDITNRAAAQAHARCVALRTQYRYPQVIADIVNEFCYDGLLDTQWRGELDGAVVTFIDTSGHRDSGLQKYGSSWTHPLGLELLDVIYRFRDTTGSMGLVCPYNAHAHKAELLVQSRGYDMSCGTSHRFQGRQFDTVIVDLMQDNRPRWVAAADLSGSERQVSAAKLLNVAITRAKRRLFLIGDWRFVRSSRAPGMRALANLRHSDRFELVHADDIVQTSTHE